MTVMTQGTELYIGDPYDDSIFKVYCPTGITGLGGAREQIPITCLDSEEAEFAPGFATPGPVSVPLNLDFSEPSHVRLYELFQSTDQTNVQVAIGLSDGKGIPPTSVDSSGFVLPTTRTWLQFAGYVADVPIDLALGSVVQGTMTIQRSGAIDVQPKAA